MPWAVGVRYRNAQFRPSSLNPLTLSLIPFAASEFDWIFFDCFNTLIDDFDEHGDENGLGSLPQLAVTLGYYSKPEAFVETYIRVRREGNSKGDGGETLLTDRLTRVLQAGDT